MQRFKKWFDPVLVAGLVFLFFLFLFEHKLILPAWLQVAGRIHPLFVHFPIVLILLVMILSWLPKDNDFGIRAEAAGPEIVRMAAAMSAVFGAIMGMLLSMEGERNGPILSRHKWIGIAVALLAAAYYFYYRSFQQKRLIGRGLTALAATGVLLTGHLGGDLTHGDNYVLAPVLHKGNQHVPPDKAVAFYNVIKPIFEAKCLQCHSSGSAKGSLVLEDVSGLQAGGKSGKLFVAGDVQQSLILQRIQLPDDDSKHMPPASKPQLTAEESLLLAFWVKSGAPTDLKLINMPVEDTFRLLAQRWLSFSDAEEEEVKYDFSAADEKKVAALNTNYRVIETMGKNSPALTVHFYGRAAYSAKALEELIPLKKQITELNLARMPVKDADLRVLSKMENLKKLNLNYTDITDNGLSALADLKQLESISLSGTGIHAAPLEKLLARPNLSEVFVWNTRMDTNAIISLKKKFNRVRIENGFVDNGKLNIMLSAPTLEVNDSVFETSLKVALKHPYKGVQIKFTRDGSVPDSSHGEIYTGPLVFDSTVFLVARSFKEGWQGSLPVSSDYLQSLRPDSIRFINKPDTLYKNVRPQILSDGQIPKNIIFNEVQKLNSEDGQWLGYRKQDASFYIYLKKINKVHRIVLYTLSQAAFDNFPPSKIQLWGGLTKGNMRLLSSLQPTALNQADSLLPVRPQILFFAPAEVRCLRLLVSPLKKMPAWSTNKGKPARLFISEIVIN